jgi:hypothetical protein
VYFVQKVGFLIPTEMQTLFMWEMVVAQVVQVVSKPATVVIQLVAVVAGAAGQADTAVLVAKVEIWELQMLHALEIA